MLAIVPWSTGRMALFRQQGRSIGMSRNPADDFDPPDIVSTGKCGRVGNSSNRKVSGCSAR